MIFLQLYKYIFFFFFFGYRPLMTTSVLPTLLSFYSKGRQTKRETMSKTSSILSLHFFLFRLYHSAQGRPMCTYSLEHVTTYDQCRRIFLLLHTGATQKSYQKKYGISFEHHLLLIRLGCSTIVTSSAATLHLFLIAADEHNNL